MCPRHVKVYLTYSQVHVVSFSEGSQSVQTPALIIALQTLNKTCHDEGNTDFIRLRKKNMMKASLVL